MLRDLIDWNIVFDKDESGNGNSGDPEGSKNKEGNGSEDSKTTEIDWSKVDVTKIPDEVIFKNPKFVEVKKEAENHRKGKADLRKQIESLTKESTDEKLDNSDNKNDDANPLAERLANMEKIMQEQLRGINLAKVVDQLNKDEKGNKREMLTEKHLKFIQGNTLEEMLASGKEVITSFDLDKKQFNSGIPGQTSDANADAARKARIRAKVMQEENVNAWDVSMHGKSGGFGS